MHSPSVHGCAYVHVLRQTSYKISPPVLPETTQRGEAEKARVAIEIQNRGVCSYPITDTCVKYCVS